MSKISYEDRGVSPDKPDVEYAIAGTDPDLFPGAFCPVSPDIFGGDPDFCTLMHADGVGTKSTVAMLMYRETGDYRVFEGLAQDSLVMNTDDLLCVGATGPMLVSNTLGRNARVFNKEMLRHVIQGYQRFGKRLSAYGIDLHFCGGETADIGDLVRSVVIDSTISTRMRRSAIINAADVQPGQVIIGLASFGQAIYEESENSGIGTNGLTAVRHELLASTYRGSGPETYDPETADHAYTGRFLLGDLLPHGGGMTIGEALLSPTRTYLPVVKKLLDDKAVNISAIFHNTGGGLTKCLKFGSGIRYVKNSLFEMPPVFRAVCEAGNMSTRDLVRVLNLGQRLEIVCAPDDAGAVIATAESFGIAAKVMGHTEKIASGVEVEITFAGECHLFQRN